MLRLSFIYLLLIIPSVVFAYPEEVNGLYIEMYSSSLKPSKNDNLSKMIEVVRGLEGTDIEMATYINIAEEFRVRTDANKKKDKKKKLKAIEQVLVETEILKAFENRNQDPMRAVDYMTSRANLLIAGVNYASIFGIQGLAGDAEKLYNNSLLLAPNNFMTLFSTAMSISFKPRFVGGGVKVAMPLFLRAVANAKLNYEKFMIYIWLSQVFFEMDDMSSYKEYLGMATFIYPQSFLLKVAKELNGDKDTLFDQ